MQFVGNLDLFLLFLRVMLHQEIQNEDPSDKTSRFIARTGNEIPKKYDVIRHTHVTNAYKMLNHFMRDKSKVHYEKNEDEIDVFGKLLAIRLRQFNRIEREEIMYEIDGIFLDRCRHLECASPEVDIKGPMRFKDREHIVSPVDCLVSGESGSSMDEIVNEVFRIPDKRNVPEDYSSTISAVSYESFASFDVTPDSTHKIEKGHGMKVCNNMTCDATQTYVRSYVPQGLMSQYD